MDSIKQHLCATHQTVETMLPCVSCTNNVFATYAIADSVRLKRASEKWEHAFEELTIAVESSLKPENFVYVQPAGVSNFSWVEFEVSRQPFL